MPRTEKFQPIDQLALTQEAERLRSEYLGELFSRWFKALSRRIDAIVPKREELRGPGLVNPCKVEGLDERTLQDIGLCRNETPRMELTRNSPANRDDGRKAA